MSIALDRELTVPFGNVDPDTLDYGTNDGRTQLAAAAYAVVVTNTSSTAYDFNVTVADLPAGWTIFGTAAGRTDLVIALEQARRSGLASTYSPTRCQLSAATSHLASPQRPSAHQRQPLSTMPSLA